MIHVRGKESPGRGSKRRSEPDAWPSLRSAQEMMRAQRTNQEHAILVMTRSDQQEIGRSEWHAFLLFAPEDEDGR
jgi:hypothetical protein